MHIGIGSFPVPEIQATDSSLSARAACPDLPEIVIVPEKNVAMQVIHIVFRLMITKQLNGYTGSWEKPVYKFTKYFCSKTRKKIF